MKLKKIEKYRILSAAIDAQAKELKEFLTLDKKCLGSNQYIIEGIARVQESIAKLKSFSKDTVFSSADSEGAIVIYSDEKDNLIHYVFILNGSACRCFSINEENLLVYFVQSDFLGDKKAGEIVHDDQGRPGDGNKPSDRKILAIY